MQINTSKVKIDNNARKEKRLYLILVSISAVILLLGLSMFPITQYHYFPPCPWHKITGTFCPGCGTVRGIQSMIDGNIFGLLQNNPLAMVALLFLGFSFFSTCVQSFRGYKPISLLLSKKEIVLLVIIVILYWILRNYWTILTPNPL